MNIHPSPSSPRDTTVSLTPAALGAASNEPSHIHIPRPSRARQSSAGLEVEPAIEILSELDGEQAA